MKITDKSILDWAARHDFHRTLTDLRAAFEDAASRRHCDKHTPAHASEPWTVENIEDVWIVRIGTLRIVTSKANAIALRDAHNATIQPAHASEPS